MHEINRSTMPIKVDYDDTDPRSVAAIAGMRSRPELFTINRPLVDNNAEYQPISAFRFPHTNGKSDGELIDQVSHAETIALLDESIGEQNTAQLGEVATRTDIKSSLSPFLVLPEYRTQYPTVIAQSLGNLHAEYNKAFRPSVVTNKEWNTDYQYCITPDGTPINGWVQIDMVGLPDRFLKTAATLGENEVREALRVKIFEIENSLAMYQLLENIFSNGQQDTLFKRQFRVSLNDLRERYGKPIALLAITEEKYKAMKESEFGKSTQELLTDTEVMKLSGFDRFFSPGEFKKYSEANGGKCDYLLYVRSSDPESKLRNPNMKVENPLLKDANLRRIIKANSITFNIDNPTWAVGDPRRINDTKAYMPPMGMAFPVYSIKDFSSPDFKRYLTLMGIDPEQAESSAIHVKPMQASYGCYGHEAGTLNSNRFLKEVAGNLSKRGPYVAQPEMRTPIIINQTDGIRYTYIDRVFLSTDGQNYRFMGGFRSLMPIASVETKNGRNHGSKDTVWAEISLRT